MRINSVVSVANEPAVYLHISIPDGGPSSEVADLLLTL